VEGVNVEQRLRASTFPSYERGVEIDGAELKRSLFFPLLIFFHFPFVFLLALSLCIFTLCYLFLV
jgi:hypothetical protein